MNPIVKNVALKLCETAPACLLEILFEVLIKTWNDYILEYNLPFRRIDIADLKGMTPVENTAIGNYDSNNPESEYVKECNIEEVILEHAEEDIFINYFRDQVHSTPPKDLFSSDNDDNLLGVKEYSSQRENVVGSSDDNNKGSAKQPRIKNYKRNSVSDLISLYSSDDSDSITLENFEEQNEQVSGNKDIQKETQTSGNHKILEDTTEGLNKAAGEQEESVKYHEFFESILKGNSTKHEIDPNPPSKNLSPHSSNSNDGELSSKLNSVTDILSSSTTMKCLEVKSPKTSKYKQPNNSCFLKDPLVAGNKKSCMKTQNDAALATFLENVKESDKVKGNSLKNVDVLSGDTKVDSEKTQGKHTKNIFRMKSKMDLNELAEFFRIPEIPKSQRKKISIVNGTLRRSSSSSRTNEKGDSFNRNIPAYKGDKTLEHSKMLKLNFKHPKKPQTLLWNTNSVFQTGRKMFNNSLHEVKRNSDEKHPLGKTNLTKKPKKKMGSGKNLSQKKTNKKGNDHHLEELSDALYFYKTPKSRHFFHGILDDVTNNKNSDEDSNNSEFITSQRDSGKNVKRSDNITSNTEDSGNIVDIFRNRKTVLFGNCSECTVEQPVKKISASHISRKLLKKDIPLQTYYKDRRLRSKSRSLDRTKRKNLGLSRRLERVASKRVVFTEDNSIFSYDPNESIFESFYCTTPNRPLNDHKEEIVEKTVTVRGAIDLVISGEGPAKDVTEVEFTAEEKYTAQGHKNACANAKEEIKGVEHIDETNASEEYKNLAFVDVPSFDCFPDFEQTHSAPPPNVSFDENEQLLSKDKTSSVSQKFNRFAEMSKITECNMKRWFSYNGHKKTHLKKITAAIFQGSKHQK